MKTISGLTLESWQAMKDYMHVEIIGIALNGTKIRARVEAFKSGRSSYVHLTVPAYTCRNVEDTQVLRQVLDAAEGLMHLTHDQLLQRAKHIRKKVKS